MDRNAGQLHVVLGGSGAIGWSVITELLKRNLPVRAVERNKPVAGVDTVFANLLNRREAIGSMKDATHVYMCVGLPYKTKVWESDWPALINSVVDACIDSGARLVFFDDVYLYGPPPLQVPFDENHLQSPTTRKGKIRKIVADTVISAHKLGKIRAVIGRSADFYGPHAVNSQFYIKYLENILSGKNPQILFNPNIKHTYAYTLDNGRALVDLALNDDAYGEAWHLPVGAAITMDEILEIINTLLGTHFKNSCLPRRVSGLMSLFVPIIKEAQEMLYQFDNPYIMSDVKFRSRFPSFETTNYKDGLNAMIESFKK